MPKTLQDYEKECEKLHNSEAKRAMVKGFATTMGAAIRVLGLGAGPFSEAPAIVVSGAITVVNGAETGLHWIKDKLNLSQTKLDCQTWMEYKKTQDDDKANKILYNNEQEVKIAAAAVDEAWHSYANSFAPDDPHAPVRAFDKPKLNEAKAAAAFNKYFRLS